MTDTFLIWLEEDLAYSERKRLATEWENDALIQKLTVRIQEGYAPNAAELTRAEDRIRLLTALDDEVSRKRDVLLAVRQRLDLVSLKGETAPGSL